MHSPPAWVDNAYWNGAHQSSDCVGNQFLENVSYAQIDFCPSEMENQVPIFFRLIGKGFCGSVVSRTHFEVPGASPRWQEFQLLPGGSVAPPNDAVPTSQCKPVFLFVLFCLRTVFVRHTNDWHLTDRSSPPRAKASSVAAKIVPANKTSPGSPV